MTTEPTQANQNVVELVSFRLQSGVSQEDFLATNDAMQTFIAGLPGLLYRSLTYNPESNEWMDIVYWATMENAQHAQSVFMSSDAAQKMMPLIDPDTVRMQHNPVLFATGCGDA